MGEPNDRSSTAAYNRSREINITGSNTRSSNPSGDENLPTTLSGSPDSQVSSRYETPAAPITPIIHSRGRNRPAIGGSLSSGCDPSEPCASTIVARRPPSDSRRRPVHRRGSMASPRDELTAAADPPTTPAETGTITFATYKTDFFVPFSELKAKERHASQKISEFRSKLVSNDKKMAQTTKVLAKIQAELAAVENEREDLQKKVNFHEKTRDQAMADKKQLSDRLAADLREVFEDCMAMKLQDFSEDDEPLMKRARIS